MSCSNNLGILQQTEGLLPQAESESTRIRHLRECIHRNSYVKQSYSCAICRTILRSNAYSAPGEHQRILTKAVTCADGTPRSIYRKPPYSSACTSIQSISGDSFTFSSIAGIDNIAILIRNTGSSENTSRKKVAIEVNASVPFFRNPSRPPPPCNTKQVYPQRIPYLPPYGQPGVPTAPNPPCIVGNRRVDSSAGM